MGEMCLLSTTEVSDLEELHLDVEPGFYVLVTEEC